MNIEALITSWQKNFPDFLPAAHKFKVQFSERWFRIHTLPESKRYAENEDEYREIFRRHNTFLSDLFGLNQPFYLLTTGFGSSTQKVANAPDIKNLGLQNDLWFSFQWSEGDQDFEPSYAYIFFDEKRWRENSLNELFRLVANDKVGNVMLFSAVKNFVYHPYDGGADIIFENTELRDFYKEKYQNWLSKHPSGY